MKFAAPGLVREPLVGDGANAAHTNEAAGRRGGLVETACTTAEETPRIGHPPFVTVVPPGVPGPPFALFVNAAATADEPRVELACGGAHAGVTGGVASEPADGALPMEKIRDLLCVSAVGANPGTHNDEEAVNETKRRYMRGAMGVALGGSPSSEDVLKYAGSPANQFFGGVR